MLLPSILVILLGICRVAWAKAVFAHFMMQNTETFTPAQWEKEIQDAKDAHIDGFALNMVWPWKPLMTQLSYAFTAANNKKGFYMIFSFDYAGGDPDIGWPKSEVINLLKIYGKNGAYFQHENKVPLVSTFEGPAWYADWPEIKKTVPCHFVPSWSSLGAKRAVSSGVVDGLFSWGAWPEGPNNMNTEIDASYKEFLNGKTYMMPVSPWFYTNLPNFGGKNWVWRGDSLWSDRWQQVWFRNPEYVQIISWNDYGESHHISDIDESQMEAFDRGGAPYNYARAMSHRGWRMLLPYVIDIYKTGTGTIGVEKIVAWNRVTPGALCGTGGTKGNTASQLQKEYTPAQIFEDAVFYTAMLASDAQLVVTIGGSVVDNAGWTRKPKNGMGLYQGKAAFGGRTGQVVIKIMRNNVEVFKFSGTNSITTACTNPNGLANYNAVVAYADGPRVTVTTPALSKYNCTEGFGVGDYNELCKYACQYGYCPETCTCSAMGPLLAAPKETGKKGHPKPGVLCGFKGLCDFGCIHGNCPSALCTTDPAAEGKCAMPVELPMPPLPTPGSGSISDDFDGCVKGTGVGNMAGLCDFSCYYGFCPRPCTCLERGASRRTRPVATKKSGYSVRGMTMDYSSLCNFTVWHDYLAPAACTDNLANAADYYVNFPAIGVFTASNSKRATRHIRRDMSRVRRQTNTVPHYLKFTTDYIKRLCKSPGPHWGVYLCRYVNNPTEAKASLFGSDDWVKKWKEAGGSEESVSHIFEGYTVANKRNDLKGSYKDDFQRTLAAVYGGSTGPWGGFVMSGEQWRCGDMVSNSKCTMQTFDYPLERSNIPVFNMMIQQFSNIHILYNSIYTATTIVQVDLYAKAQKLVKEFGKEDEVLPKILQGIADSLGIIALVGGGAVISGAMTTVFATIGGASGVATSGISLFKTFSDSADEAKNQMERVGSLQEKTAVIAEQLRNGLVSSLTQLFSGTDDGVKALTTLIQSGHFLEPAGNIPKAVKPLEQVFLAQLIPTAWRQDSTVHPVILVAEGSSRPFPGLKFDDAKEVAFDYQGYTMWLLDASPCVQSSNPNSFPICYHKYNKLRGFDTLKSSADISVRDLVESSFDAWQLKQKDPAWKLSADFVSPGDKLPLMRGARTPGFFSVPVCTYDVLEKNLGPDPKCADYPCCP